MIDPAIENAFGTFLSFPIPLERVSSSTQMTGEIVRVSPHQIEVRNLRATIGDICIVKCERTLQHVIYVVVEFDDDNAALVPIDAPAHVRPGDRVSHSPNFNRVLVGDHLLNRSCSLGEGAFELLEGRSGTVSEMLGTCRETQDSQPTNRRVLDEHVSPETVVEIFYGGRAFFKGALEWEHTDAALAMGSAFDVTVVVSPVATQRLYNLNQRHIREFAPYVHIFADVHRSNLYLSATVQLASAIARGFGRTGMDVSLVVDRLITESIRANESSPSSGDLNSRNPFDIRGALSEHGELGFGTITSFWEADLYKTSQV